MNAVASQIRHYLTFLAGLGGLLLSWHLIAPEDVAKANEAGAALIEPLTVLVGLVAAGVTRLAIAWLTNFFNKAKDSGGTSGGVGLLLAGLLIGTAAVGTLPSCSPAQIAAVRAVPLKVCATYHGVEVCASSSK